MGANQGGAMNKRRKLAMALGAAALCASCGSFAQEKAVDETPSPGFYPSTTKQNISRPEPNSAVDVMFLKDLTIQANSMIGKRANEVAEIAQSVQAKLEGEQMKSLLVRLNSNPDNAFRLSVHDQIHALRTFTAAALEHVAKIQSSTTPSSKPQRVP
jgi:type IV secretory pathway TrbL component